MSDRSPAPFAQLQWSDDGQPRSAAFNDVYFSRDDGLEETRYVFLQQNRLPQRFAALQAHEDFVIGETGFGSGLNFLAAWELWRQLAPDNGRLHFISVEKYPLCAVDLQRALALWPALSHLREALLQHYPAVLTRGCHRLRFDDGRVNLTLIIEDACVGLEQSLLSGHPAFARPRRAVDAWFLDGFAPARNPDMWQARLFELLQQLSQPGTSLATFTAAAVVKQGLAGHGFRIRKLPGFGRKRDMLTAELQQAASLPAAAGFPTQAYSSPHPQPWPVVLAPTCSDKAAIVAGGGIAGCHIARALAERGWQVQLLEQHAQLAAEASGNPQGVVYARLSHRSETLSDFNLLALQFAQRRYHEFWQQCDPEHGSECGLLQLQHAVGQAQAQRQLLDKFGEQRLLSQVDAGTASELAGLQLQSGGLYFPNGGWLNPHALCRWLTDHPAIRVITGCRLKSATQTNPGWRVDTDNDIQLQAGVLVLCTANAVTEFMATRELPVKPIRGQISYIAANDSSLRLRSVICGEGYITPALAGVHCVGASFNPARRDTELSADEHRHNLDLLLRQLPQLGQRDAIRIEGGRAALRCSSPDYLPLVGPAPHYQRYLDTYSLLRKNARSSTAQAGPVWDGLFVSAGYGSRGLAYTPLCAELLAAQINSEPGPVDRDMEAALHPGRFWIRGLCRGKI